jgi:hypothetical protein
MKQTAVDWLYALSKERELDIFDLEQAKEMEKNQIVDAFDIACEDSDRIGVEYYDQTYTNHPENYPENQSQKTE